jgi:hypothetical protein
VPTLFLLVASPPGAATPVPLVLHYQLVSHKSGHCGH